MLVNGVDFEKKYNLILTGLSIGSPEPKVFEIEVPGRSKLLDMTEYFGETKYNEREIAIELSNKETGYEFIETIAEIMDAVHGKVATCAIAEESYFQGRAKVENSLASKGIQSLKIIINAEPYRYRSEVTEYMHPGAGSAEKITLNNWQKKVAPLITATAETSIAFNGKTYNFDTGEFKAPFLLEAGENELEVTTTGTVTFKYQERGF